MSTKSLSEGGGPSFSFQGEVVEAIGIKEVVVSVMSVTGVVEYSISIK